LSKINGEHRRNSGDIRLHLCADVFCQVWSFVLRGMCKCSRGREEGSTSRAFLRSK
jgi:hypothetical protein